LHKALNVAVQQHHIPINVAEGIVLPQVERKPPNPLTDSQLIKLLDRIKSHEKRDIYIFDLLTGLRESELIGLTVDCFNRDDRTLNVYRQLIYKIGSIIMNLHL
jgi:integrase